MPATSLTVQNMYALLLVRRAGDLSFLGCAKADSNTIHVNVLALPNLPTDVCTSKLVRNCGSMARAAAKVHWS